MSTARQELIATLKAAPKNSVRFLEALRDADTRTLGEAIKELILRPAGLSVNRSRHTALVDHLVMRATATPVFELSAAREGKEVAL